MKKIVIMMIGLSFLLSVSCKEKPADVKLKGIINFITGDVIIKSSSGESKAMAGDLVAEGVTVKTGAGSVAAGQAVQTAAGTC